MQLAMGAIERGLHIVCRNEAATSARKTRVVFLIGFLGLQDQMEGGRFEHHLARPTVIREKQRVVVIGQGVSIPVGLLGSP